MSRFIQSLSLSGLITLDLHALNNEGSEGNQLQTRQVQIVDGRGTLHAVNAISGDMFKHIQASYFYRLAKEVGLPICEGCRVFDANRINGDEKFFQNLLESPALRQAELAGLGDSHILTQVLRECAVDDVEGILITRKVPDRRARPAAAAQRKQNTEGSGEKERMRGLSIPRKSVVEFGWVVGRPEMTRTDSFMHAKYVPEGRGKGSGGDTGLNLGQNIFHRPASSGQYAVVVHADLYRVGQNDITLDSVLPPDAIAKRCGAVLRSLLATFIRPTGAQRNTQNPHVVNFEGAIALSRGTLPAPTVSALSLSYREQLRAQRDAFSRLTDQVPELREFNTLGEFSTMMADLVNQVEEG